MNDDGYRGGPATESKWGCVVAGLIGIPIFIVLLLNDALGDCVPDTECKKGFLTQVLLPSAVITVGLFLLARWAIRTARENNR